MLITLNTKGAGLWSNRAAAVPMSDIELSYVNDDETFGELRVYFDSLHWDCDEDGLIYTDPQWLEELRAWLNQQGLPGADVDYSEQGMQGDDFVSLDVGEEFLSAWHKNNGCK